MLCVLAMNQVPWPQALSSGLIAMTVGGCRVHNVCAFGKNTLLNSTFAAIVQSNFFSIFVFFIYPFSCLSKKQQKTVSIAAIAGWLGPVFRPVRYKRL